MTRLVLTVAAAALALCMPCLGAEEAVVGVPQDDEAIRAVAAEIMTGAGDGAAEGQAPEGAGEPVQLDMRQCVMMTLENNPQVFMAENDALAVRERIGQAKSSLYPRIKADTAFTHVEPTHSQSQSAMISEVELAGSLVEILGGYVASGTTGALGGLISGTTTTLFDNLLIPGGLQLEKDSRQDHLNVTQVLYAGGQVRAAIRASEYLAQSQEWRCQASLNSLEYQAKQAYLNVLLTRAILKVAQESVVTFKRHLADADQMLEVGLVSNFEVLRAKTELGARITDATTAHNAERVALLNLRRIIGQPQDAAVRLVGGLDWTPVDKPVEELVALAMEQRPEIRALKKGIAAASEDVRRLKGKYRPSAAATFDWTNVDSGGLFVAEGWTIGMGIEWNIYSGGRRKHEVGEAGYRVASLQHQLDDTEQLVELDVRNACIQIQDAKAKIQSEKGTVELGREGLRLAEVRFQEGVGTQAETLDAELALTNAETGLVIALHNYALAHAALERALGQSWAPEAPAASDGESLSNPQ